MYKVFISTYGMDHTCNFRVQDIVNMYTLTTLLGMSHIGEADRNALLDRVTITGTADWSSNLTRGGRSFVIINKV